MGIKRGDIVWANLDGAIGSEQGKERVCVVIQNDVGNKYSPTTIVVPLTSELKKINQPTHAIINKQDATGLHFDSMVLCEQVRTIDKRRIIEKAGKVLNKNTLRNILFAYLANAGEMEELFNGEI